MLGTIISLYRQDCCNRGEGEKDQDVVLPHGLFALAYRHDRYKEMQRFADLLSNPLHNSLDLQCNILSVLQRLVDDMVMSYGVDNEEMRFIRDNCLSKSARLYMLKAEAAVCSGAGSNHDSRNAWMFWLALAHRSIKGFGKFLKA